MKAKDATKELMNLWKLQFKWIKKYWLFYLVFCAIVGVITFCNAYFELWSNFTDWIRSKF